MNSPICERCILDCEEPCAAWQELAKHYHALRREEKTVIIRNLREQLDLVDYEVADDLRELGEAVIAAMPELGIISDFDIKVGYVRGYEAKKDNGNPVMADCRKVSKAYLAYLPYDFIVTFYEPNIAILSENQKKILMLHELRHIGIGTRGLRIVDHDVQDFRDILQRFGITWSDFNQDVPDILAGGDNGQQAGNKRKGLAAEPKADQNGRAAAKPRRQKD